MEKHYAPKVYARVKCSVCSVQVNSKGHLRRHLKGVHKIEAKTCEYRGCSAYFFNQQGLNKHVKEIHSAQVEEQRCNECGFKTRLPLNLHRHKLNKHGKESLPCAKCPKTFKSKPSLQMHHRRAHEPVNKCTHCNGVVKKMWDHLNVASCPKCQLISACKGLAKVHLKSCCRNISVVGND